MRFPNLLWALRNRRITNWELAQKIKMDPSRFSRCLNGRFEFAPHERNRIAELLGYERDWLFALPSPPLASARSETVSAAVACAAAKT